MSRWFECAATLEVAIVIVSALRWVVAVSQESRPFHAPFLVLGFSDVHICSFVFLSAAESQPTRLTSSCLRLKPHTFMRRLCFLTTGLVRWAYKDLLLERAP